MGIGKLFNWLRRKPEPAPIPGCTVDGDADRAALPRSPGRPGAGAPARALSEAFLAEKEFSSAGGLELTDAICVSIAAQACLPILNLGLENYRHWVGIVVYPDEFVIPRVIEDDFGVVPEFDDVASGEAWDGGPVLISWHDAQMAGEGYNVVIHEFAHKLDMLNGEANGVPPLPNGVPRQQWEEALFAAYDDFCARVDAAAESGDEFAEGVAADLRAENPGEFFAVMSESFFETPALLRRDLPDFYAWLVLFYRAGPGLALSCLRH